MRRHNDALLAALDLLSIARVHPDRLAKRELLLLGGWRLEEARERLLAQVEAARSTWVNDRVRPLMLESLKRREEAIGRATAELERLLVD